MKKILILALALIMVLSVFVSCGKDDPKDTTEESEETENNDPIDIPDGFTAFASPKTLYVNTTKLNVRSAPEVVEGNVVGSYNHGDKVKALAENGDWTYIDYNGTPAYVSSDYLTDEKPDDTTKGPDVDPSTAETIADSSFSEPESDKVYVYATDTNDNHVDMDVNAYLRPYKEKWTDQDADYWFENYTELTRIGVYIDAKGTGWSKIKHVDEGQEVIVYIRNSQLVTELPDDVKTEA